MRVSSWAIYQSGWGPVGGGPFRVSSKKLLTPRPKGEGPQVAGAVRPLGEGRTFYPVHFGTTQVLTSPWAPE